MNYHKGGNKNYKVDVGKLIVCLIAGIALAFIAINAFISGQILDGIVVMIFALLFLGIVVKEIREEQ